MKYIVQINNRPAKGYWEVRVEDGFSTERKAGDWLSRNGFMKGGKGWYRLSSFKIKFPGDKELTVVSGAMAYIYPVVNSQELGLELGP